MTTTGPTPMTAPGRVPLLGHALPLLRSPLAVLESIHDQGDIVRLDIGLHPIWVVNHPDLIWQVLAKDSDRFGRGRVQAKVRPGAGNGLVFSEGEFHHQQRRYALPAFSRERLRGYAEIMRAGVVELSDSWIPGRRVKLDDELHSLSTRITYRTIFGSDLTAEDIAEIRTAVTAFLRATTRRGLLPDAFDRLPGLGYRRYLAACHRMDLAVNQIIREHREHPGDRRDLLSALMAVRNEQGEPAMNDTQLSAELHTFLLAGTETIAATLSWLFYELGKQPDLEERAAAEADTILAGRLVEFDDLPQLVFTRRAIDETLRLHSPGWIFMRRPFHDITLGATVVPAGTDLFLNVRALHRSPEHYDHPLDYDPDRWEVTPPRQTFFPFGGGVHKCIGDHFAETAMTIAAATLIQSWHFEPVPKARVKEVPLAAIRPNQVPVTLRRANRGAYSSHRPPQDAQPVP